MAETIPINRISTDGTQTRAAFNDTVIDEYAEVYEQGVDLPPIDVYFDQETYWLADGFHRLKAVQKLRRDAIAANVSPGGQRDAILHAVGANEAHGLRRSSDDRRKAVLLMLDDPEWCAWSDREIARQCRVSHMLVNRVRREIAPPEKKRATEETRKAKRGDTVYPIHTGRIGKTRKHTASLAPPDSLQVETHATAAPAVEPGLPEPLASTETPSVTVLQIEADAPPPGAPEHAAVAQKPASPPDVPPESLLTAEPGPSEMTPDTVAVGRITLEPQATTMAEELLQQVTLAVRWDYATSGERQTFVAEHRDELRKMLARLDRKQATAS